MFDMFFCCATATAFLIKIRETILPKKLNIIIELLITVELLNKDTFRTSHSVLCREVFLIQR